MCVFGAGRPDYTQMGGQRTQGAKQTAPLCARTPTAPPVGGARPSSGGAHRTKQQGQQWQCKRHRCAPVLPRPTFRWNVRARAAHIGPSKTAPNCARPNSHGPACRRSSSELQGDVHSGPNADARTSEGWGDATDAGVMWLSSPLRVVHPRGTARWL